MTKRDLSGISRRDFLRITQRFGMKLDHASRSAASPGW